MFEIGKKYPLNFLETKENILTLQYNFKPSTIDLNKTGNLTLLENGEAFTELKTTDDSIEKFKGSQLNPLNSVSNNELLLSFKNGGFNIQKISTSIVNLRHVRDEQQFSNKKIAPQIGLNAVKQVNKLGKTVKKKAVKSKPTLTKKEIENNHEQNNTSNKKDQNSKSIKLNNVTHTDIEASNNNIDYIATIP
jgi:hypothetical protein